LQQEVYDQVFFPRIQKGNEAYPVTKLGVFGSELGAVACFFEKPWERLPQFSRKTAKPILNRAAFYMRALGRLTEALDPMRAGMEMAAKQKDWSNAANGASNVSELELTLGEVARAVGDAEQSVTYADRRAEAEARFREAEQLQTESQPAYPLLYSLRGLPVLRCS
jgi:hypothetical protein